MFKKTKSPEKEDEIMPTPERSDFSATPTAQSTSTKTVIGERITINGDIQGKEDLLIEGSLIGKVELENNQVTIGSKGRVEAKINAKNVIINGQLAGDIQASGTVKITKDAKFGGEIKARSISVEDGAYLKAAIELQRDPAKKGPTEAKPVPKPAPGAVGTTASQSAEKSPLGPKPKPYGIDVYIPKIVFLRSPPTKPRRCKRLRCSRFGALGDAAGLLYRKPPATRGMR